MAVDGRAAVVIAAVVVAVVAAGWDVAGWLGAVWNSLTSISLLFLVPALLRDRRGPQQLFIAVGGSFERKFGFLWRPTGESGLKDG